MALPALPTAENELGSVVDGVDLVNAAHVNTLRRFIEALSIAPRAFGTSPNQIIVDPANSRIQYTGTCRPTEHIELGYQNLLSSTSSSSFDGGGVEATSFVEAAVGIDAANLRGFRTRAITIPWWMDVADTIEVRGWFQPQVVVASAVLVFGCRYDRVREGDSTPIAENSSLGNLSSAQTVSYRQQQQLFGTFPGGTFAVGDHISFAIFRDGTHASDTYDTAGGASGTCRISTSAFLRGRRKYA